MTWIILKLKS